jgi:multidrug efflux pump subunit AcrA (membrane-fusion protein)
MNPRLILFLLTTLIFSCGKKGETLSPSNQEIVESVYASAKIKAFQQYSQKVSIGGKLLNYFVSEGDIVKAGQSIAQLENISPELSVKNAEMAFQIARENESQLQELVYQSRNANKQLIFDSITYFKQLRLFKNDIGTKNQLDAFKLKFETSKNAYSGIIERLNSQRHIVSRAKEQAKNNLEISKKNNADFTITSYIEGKIYSLPYEIGEMVSPLQEFAVIGNDKQFILEMDIDESDIAKIKIGQKIIVKLEAYKQTFEATVSKIYPSLDPKSQSFKIEGKFSQEMPKLYPGLTAEANIITNTKSNALVIPLSYLVEEKYVMTKNGKLEVETGLRNFNFVEITKGIDKSTVLMKP